MRAPVHSRPANPLQPYPYIPISRSPVTIPACNRTSSPPIKPEPSKREAFQNTLSSLFPWPGSSYLWKLPRFKPIFTFTFQPNPRMPVKSVSRRDASLIKPYVYQYCILLFSPRPICSIICLLAAPVAALLTNERFCVSGLVKHFSWRFYPPLLPAHYRLL